MPKHRGLSVFILPLHQPGIEIHRIEMLNGFKDFCQEFITDVRVPDTDRIGDVDEGWTVGTRWMFHERMLHNSPYVTSVTGSSRQLATRPALRRRRPRQRPPRRPGRAATCSARPTCWSSSARRSNTGSPRASRPARCRTRRRRSAGCSPGVARCGSTSIAVRARRLERASPWDDDDGEAAEFGNDFLLRQVATLGGGTTEMARNVVSERVLGMPRELSHDRNTPFRDVPKGPPAK